MKYSPTMTPAETAQLMDEINALDAAYADADLAAQNSAFSDDGAEEEAAYEQSLDYFNRYIAGDR